MSVSCNPCEVQILLSDFFFLGASLVSHTRWRHHTDTRHSQHLWIWSGIFYTVSWWRYRGVFWRVGVAKIRGELWRPQDHLRKIPDIWRGLERRPWKFADYHRNHSAIMQMKNRHETNKKMRKERFLLIISKGVEPLHIVYLCVNGYIS